MKARPTMSAEQIAAWEADLRTIVAPPTVEHAPWCRCPRCNARREVTGEPYVPKPPRVRRPPPNSAIVHGTISAYSNRGCRCDLCSEARRGYDRMYVARHKAALDGLARARLE